MYFYFPNYGIGWMILILVLLVLLFFCKPKARVICYIAILLIITVFARSYSERRLVLDLFWSYRVLSQGFSWMTWQVIYNVVMTIPLGFLSAIVYKKRVVIAIGLGTSLLIEILQYILARGTSEFDDIFNNVLGTIIGIAIYYLVKTIKKVRSKVEK